MLIVLCAALLLSGCEEQETMQYVYEEGAYEASPDAGLSIYVEGKKEDKTIENQIYFYRQYGTISAFLPIADEKVQIGDSYYATHYRSERDGLILEEVVFQADFSDFLLE